MTDVMGRVLRSALAYYDQSLPPDLLGGGGKPPQSNPHITSIAPNPVAESPTAETFTVTGTEFESGSVVEINGGAQTTTYVSATSLTFDYAPAVVGTVMVTVRNPDNGESNSVPLVVQ